MKSGDDIATETRRLWMREAGFDEVEICESIVLQPPVSQNDEVKELVSVRRLNAYGESSKPQKGR